MRIVEPSSSTIVALKVIIICSGKNYTMRKNVFHYKE
jgi:hypothetical protein